MAYSCVKVLFEIGHEASIRAKRTPDGFTHDWEVFVRGADNTDISHFVEKVVFQLHETFPKPKRVVKEPPYSIKESGYAGFVIPIDVYFKNHDEPKKAHFNYDLTLQPSGPPFSKVLREKYVFPNPSEDLRRRLIKGGGVGVVGNDSGVRLSPSAEKTSITGGLGDDTSGHKHSVPALVGKPKLGGDSSKKHKVKEHYKAEEPRVSNSFSTLFGTPIKTTKVSPDPKKSSSSHSPKVSPVSKSSKPVEKSSSEKQSSAGKSSKHSSQKETRDSSERSSTKEERKEKSKERDRSKEKPSKRPSISPKRSSTPPKRPPSPPPVKHPSTPPKRSSSPPKRPTSPSKHVPAPVKGLSSPKHLSQSSSKSSSKDETKKPSDDGKGKSDSKTGDSSKSEKKKKDKKNREDKPKKDKHKEHEKEHENRISDKSLKVDKVLKDTKDKDISKRIEKEKEPDKPKEKEKVRHTDGDKEKQRHKHKKKDKSSKDKEKEKERDKERDRSMKRSSESKTGELKDREKNGIAVDTNRNSGDGSSDVKKVIVHSPSPSPILPPASPPKPPPSPDRLSKEKSSRHPLDLLLSKVSDNESNDSLSPSEDEPEPPPVKIKAVKSSSEGNETKNIVLTESVTPPGASSIKTNKAESMKPKSNDISNQERENLNKNIEKPLKEKSSSKKNKEKETGGGDVEKDCLKVEREGSKKRKRKSSGKEEVVDSVRNDDESVRKVARLDSEPMEQDVVVSENIEPETKTEPTPQQLTEEYVNQLRELQHKIMTLEDNDELQRVVQVIAETGQYEITKKTFDFDLCALDRSTVQRLQAFFTPS